MENQELAIFVTFVQVLLFDRSIGVVVQLSVIEAYGIVVFRTEAGTGSSKLYVFRLSKVEEYLFDLNDWQRNVDRVMGCSEVNILMKVH